MDDATQNILNKYSTTAPVPVVALAQELGAKVFSSKELPDSVSGFITRSTEGTGYDIIVNANHSTKRRRFTIAHEIAHLILHKDKIDAGEMPKDFIKRPYVLARKTGKKDAEEQKMERAADTLAADIIMPEQVFKDVWRNSKDVEQVADYFNVSQAAATVRASVLTCESTL